MHHKIPTPGMDDRVFTILVASGRALFARREFFVVTVPLDPLPASMAPRTRWPGDDGGKKPPRVVRGAYAAVERVRCVAESEWVADQRAGVAGAKTAARGKKPAGQKQDPLAAADGTEPQYVYWDMATTADAGGKVPLGLQKLGLAGHVVVDVGLFCKWVDKWRDAHEPEVPEKP